MRFFLLFSAFFSLLNATGLYKGQKQFVKSCRVCHFNSQALIESKTQQEWKDLLNEDGKKLYELHVEKKVDKDKLSEYLKNEKFIKKSKYLKQFLVEYAKDSGHIPACN